MSGTLVDIKSLKVEDNRPIDPGLPISLGILSRNDPLRIKDFDTRIFPNEVAGLHLGKSVVILPEIQYMSLQKWDKGKLLLGLFPHIFRRRVLAGEDLATDKLYALPIRVLIDHGVTPVYTPSIRNPLHVTLTTPSSPLKLTEEHKIKLSEAACSIPYIGTAIAKVLIRCAHRIV